MRGGRPKVRQQVQQDLEALIHGKLCRLLLPETQMWQGTLAGGRATTAHLPSSGGCSTCRCSCKDSKIEAMNEALQTTTAGYGAKFIPT